MIDLATEPLLPLAQAARLIPPTRGGRPTHVSTLQRWITRGVRGVKLEASRVGGRWVTSAPALQRFIDRLTAEATGSAPAPPSREAERTARALDALGF